MKKIALAVMALLASQAALGKFTVVNGRYYEEGSRSHRTSAYKVAEDAIRLGDVQRLRDLIEAGLDVNLGMYLRQNQALGSWDYDLTLLTIAAGAGKAEAVRLLIDAGALPDSLTFRAAIRGFEPPVRYKIIKLFIERGDRRQRYRDLHLLYSEWLYRAVLVQDAEAVRLLLGTGVSPYIYDIASRKLLIAIAEKNETGEIVELLKTHGGAHRPEFFTFINRRKMENGDRYHYVDEAIDRTSVRYWGYTGKALVYKALGEAAEIEYKTGKWPRFRIYSADRHNFLALAAEIYELTGQYAMGVIRDGVSEDSITIEA